MKTYDTVTQRTYLSKDSTWSQINQSKFNYNTNTEFEPNSKSSQNFNTISKTSSSKSNITSKSQDCGEELQTLSTGIIISNQSNDPQNKPSSLPKDIYPTKLHNSQSSSLSQQANLTLSAISSPPMHILPSSSLNTYTINQSQYGRKQNQTTSSLSSQQSYRSHSSNSLHQAISTPPTPHSNNSNINNNSSMPMNSKQDNQSHLYNTIEQNQLRGCRFDCGVTIPLLPEYKNDSENQYNSNQVKSSRIDKQLQVDMRKENKQIKAYERENISTNRALEREKVNAELTSAQHKVNECLRVCDTLSTRISSLGATLETQPSSK
ncbi:MAG: hypothetical protein EZS28_009731 [Streblomastix strix]|uniref:Uncharacterized protein n=1 Tax=Streblomastix strix TaxID=222440 RepID=A0A5J4WIA5_9EUKA|nr:MAG: hypothetical protein EZS28_009731 [Streblomastix strix]